MEREYASEAMLRMVEANGNAFKDDARLHVTFYMGAMENPKKSEQEGRPIFDDVKMIRVLIPGDKNTISDRLAWEQDYQRFPKQYAAFKAGQEQTHAGTPLKHWSIIKESQRRELEAANIFTVDQLATAADGNIGRFMGGSQLKQAAKDFIEAAKGAAPLTQMRAELETRDTEIAALKAQMGELMKSMQAKEAANAPAAQHQAASRGR